MIPLTGFMPDADPTTPGVITDCTNIIPTLKGMKAAPSATASTDALGSEARSGAVVRLLDDSFRVFAATQTDLYELTSGTTWTDRYATTLTGSSTSFHSFCQFGDVTIAVNLVDSTLKSTGSGVAFTALAGAPKAKFCESVAGFVMMAYYNDGSAYNDGWFCSGYQDYTTWTPSVTTQCASGRLYDTPGPITGLKKLGQNAVIFKNRSMYLGQYIGPPIIWSWTLVSDSIGAPSQGAVVSINTALAWVGENDFYMFDGSQPVSIGDGIKEWFFNDVTNQYRYKITGVHDWANSCIHWYYPSAASTTIDSCVIYNYKTGKWSRANRSIECALDYIISSGGGSTTTYDGASGTFDATTDVFDASSLGTYSRAVAVFNTSHVLCTLTGAATSSSITTGDIGDDQEVTTITRVLPRWVTSPESASLTNFHRMTLGDTLTTDTTTTMSTNRFDVIRSSRWHRFTLNMTGDAEIMGADIQTTSGGME